MLSAASFFQLAEFPHADIFADTQYVWEGLTKLKAYMESRVVTLPEHDDLCSGIPLTRPLIFTGGRLSSAREFDIKFGPVGKGELAVYRGTQRLMDASIIMAGAVLMGNKITIGKGVVIEPGALIKEPAIIGDYSEIRQGAYLRGDTLIGRRCVVGHTTEVKHSIFLDDAKAGHFAYLGDSILGGNANLGAGTKFANLRFLTGLIQIRTPEGLLNTGLRKFGAILGDGAQTGCNSVTNPGTLIGAQGVLMPNTTAPSGYHRGKSVIR